MENWGLQRHATWDENREGNWHYSYVMLLGCLTGWLVVPLTRDAQWSLFLLKFRTFGLGQKIGQINSGAFGAFLANYQHHFGTVSPLSMFSIIQPLFLQNKTQKNWVQDRSIKCSKSYKSILKMFKALTKFFKFSKFLKCSKFKPCQIIIVTQKI